MEQTVTAPGSLVNARETILEMPAAGRLAEILARPGDSFKAGQVLARLDNPEQFAAEVTAAKLELLQAQQALNTLYQNAPSRQPKPGLPWQKLRKPSKMPSSPAHGRIIPAPERPPSSRPACTWR